MTERLPTVGADTGAWGTVLNGYLGTSHNADGTLKSAAVQAALGGLVPLAPSGGSDAAALVARAPDIRLGVGSFLAASGFSVGQKARVEGRGMSTPAFTTPFTPSAHSEIVCSSATADGLVLDAKGCYVDKFGIRSTAATPSAGAGLSIPASPGGEGLRVRDVSIDGFYNGMLLNGFFYLVDGVQIRNPVNYGIYVTNAVSDWGDGHINNCFLLSGPDRNGAAALRWEAGGGLQINGLKTNTINSKPWVNGVDLHALSTTGTSEISVADSVIDAYTGKGVSVACDAGGGLTGISFDNVWVRGSSNPTNGYYIRGNGTGGTTDVKIVGGGVELSTNALNCIDIDNMARVTIADIELGGVPVTVPLIPNRLQRLEHEDHDGGDEVIGGRRRQRLDDRARTNGSSVTSRPAQQLRAVAATSTSSPGGTRRSRRTRSIRISGSSSWPGPRVA